MLAKNLELRNFGEFLLRYLNVAVDVNEIRWVDVSTAYDKYQTSNILDVQEKSIDLFRPGLVYINWVISKYYNVDPVKVRRGKSRKRELTKPRQVAHYIAVVFFNFTLQSVGNFYHKDHATILYSKKTVQNEIDTNREYKTEILNILNKLKNGNSNQRTSTEGSIGEVQKAS